MKHKIRLLFVLILYSQLVFSAERISLHSGFGAKRLTHEVQFIQDTFNHLSIADLISSTNITWTNAPEWGFKKPFDGKHYWLKISIHNQQSEVFFFQSNYVILENFQLFVHDLTRDKLIEYDDLGLKSKNHKSQILHSSLVYRVKLIENTDYDFYIRLYKKFSSPALPFYLRDSTDFPKHISAVEKERGIIYGIFIILVFKGLILWLFFREKLYLFFVGYVFCSFLILFISDGTFRLYLPTDIFDYVHFSVYFIIPLCFGFIFLIVFRLLRSRELLPFWYRAALWTIGLSFVFSVSNAIGYFLLPKYPLWVFQFTTLIVLMYPFLFIVICLKTYLRTKQKQALILLTVFSVTSVFAILFALLPFVTYRFERFMEFKWIVLFESIILVFVINRDLYLSKKSKDQLAEALAEQHELASKQYLQGLLDERKRLAEELHDNVGAKIAAAKMKISTMTFTDEKNKVEILAFFNATHEDVRSAAQALSPVLLKSQGLSKILEEYFQKLEDFNLDLAIEYNFHFLSSTLQSPHEEILYLTCLELINNAIRHGKTNYLRIQLTEDSNNYRLEVEDRGIGFLPNKTKFGFGLKSIEQRAAFLNGYFEIKRKDLGTICIFKITKN